MISFIVLTVLFGMHFFGVKQAARLQNILCAILAIAIAAYIVLGIGNVQGDYLTNGFMTKGAGGFILASIYLTFAAGGAIYVVNYSSAAKNPTKDIPFVIIASTAIVVIVYAVMSTVAAGVLPVDQVANKPLSVSAAVVMPKTVYTFFVVGGAMFSLLTTLNFNIGMIVYPVMTGCKDGWLPKKLAVKNEKFGSAYLILLLCNLIGIVPILIGLDLNTIANSTVILFTIIRGVIAYSAMQLDRKLKVICIASIVIAAISVLVLLVSTSIIQICGNICILVFSIIMALIFDKRVHLSPAYEVKK